MSHLLNGMLLGTQLSKTRTYQEQIKYMLGSNLFAWYPFTETIGVSGTSVADISGNGYNGRALQAFTGGFAGPGSRSAIYCTGSFLGILTSHNVAMNSAFKTLCGPQGFVSGWGRAQTWASGTANQIMQYLTASSVDAVSIAKNNVTPRMQFVYTANSTTKTVVETTGQSSLLWRHYVITWDKTLDQMKAYTNNVQIGATQTGLGVWQNNLATAAAILLANWIGFASDIIIGSRVPTDAERTYIYTKA